MFLDRPENRFFQNGAKSLSSESVTSKAAVPDSERFLAYRLLKEFVCAPPLYLQYLECGAVKAI